MLESRKEKLMFIRFQKAKLIYDDDMTVTREADITFFVSVDAIMLFSDYKLMLRDGSIIFVMDDINRIHAKVIEAEERKCRMLRQR